MRETRHARYPMWGVEGLWVSTPGRTPRAGLKGEGFRPEEGRKVGVEGGYLPPSPPGRMIMLVFYPHPGPLSPPGEKEKSPTISFHSGAQPIDSPPGPPSPPGRKKTIDSPTPGAKPPV